jgi:ATP-dependent Clp protease adaptor protein ClpS
VPLDDLWSGNGIIPYGAANERSSATVSKEKEPDSWDPQHEEEQDVQTRRKLQRPPLYKVVFHNDDYTTRDFVVMVLMRYFHKSHMEATRIMLHIHNNGMGVAGIYPYDIASTKVAQVEQQAKQQEMPLKLSLEPDDGAGQNESDD